MKRTVTQILISLLWACQEQTAIQTPKRAHL